MKKRVIGVSRLLPLVALFLTACSGGSSTFDPPPDKLTLTGIVAKGAVQGAKVRVLTATKEGGVLTSVVTTDSDGRYTVELTRPSGPVIIEADLSGASIKSETDGTTYTGGVGDTMRAAITADATAKSVTAHITPFSEMAATSVEKSGWQAAAVKDSNNLVRQLLGNGDHLTDHPTSNFFMVTRLRTVQKLVDKKGLKKVLEELKAAVATTTTTVSISQGIFTALKDACSETAGASASDCATAFAAPPVAGVPIGTGDKTDPVFSLFQDLRDTLMAFSNDNNTGELDKAGNTLSDSVNSAIAPIDDEMLGLLDMIPDADDFYRKFKAGTSTRQFMNSGSYRYGKNATFKPDGTTVQDDLFPLYSCEIARATIQTNGDGSQDVKSDYTISGVTKDNANVFACFGTGTYGRLYPAQDGVNAYYQSIVLIPQADGNFKYVHQVRTQKFDRRVNGGAHSRFKAFFGDLEVTRDTAIQELRSFKLNGKLVPGLIGNLARLDELDRVDTNLSFVITTPTSNMEKLDISGSMTLYKTNNVFASSVEIASGSMAQAKTDVPYSHTDYRYVGNGSCPTGYTAVDRSAVPFLNCIGTVTETISAISSMTLDVAVTAPGMKFQGIVNAGTPSFDKSNTVYTPTKLSFEGKIFEADGAGYRMLLNGKGSVERLNYANFDATSNSSWPGKATFDGKVLLKNRPEMGLTLNEAWNESRNESRDGTFYWNSKNLKFTEAADGAVTVSNDSGVRFTSPKNSRNLPQDIFLGNVKVGTVNLGQKRIDYIDGRFQQF